VGRDLIRTRTAEGRSRAATRFHPIKASGRLQGRPVRALAAASKVGARKPATFSRRSTAGSPRASTRPICGKRRLSSTSWR